MVVEFRDKYESDSFSVAKRTTTAWRTIRAAGTRADGTRDVAIEAQFYAFAAEHFGLERDNVRDNVREVEVVADTAALLRRMCKAHAGAVHRLHEPQSEDGEVWPSADLARGAWRPPTIPRAASQAAARRGRLGFA